MSFLEYIDTDVRIVIGRAREKANRLEHPEIRPEHLFLGIFEDTNGAGCSLIDRLYPSQQFRLVLETRMHEADYPRGVDRYAAAREVIVAPSVIPFTREAIKIIETAVQFAKEHPLPAHQHNSLSFAGIEHIVYATAIVPDNIPHKIIVELGITPEMIIKQFSSL